MCGILPGQAVMHFPQAVHFLFLTSTAPVFLSIDKALNEHASTHG
jgi:hypothetical protein